MPRNIYNPNESREDRRQQNERVKHLLDEWMAAPAWSFDANAIEAELDEAGFRLNDPEVPKTQVSHVPVA